MGVSHQYCGQVGKQTNCQIAVSLSLANHHASLPVAYQLYVPESWTKDAERRKKAGIPKDGSSRILVGNRSGIMSFRASDINGF